MSRYVKIKWEKDAGDLPRIMELDENIENAELKEIIEAKAENRVLNITDYTPKPQYLILYVGMSIKRHGFANTLFLCLTPTCTEKYGDSLAMLKNFGKHKECELIYDAIRRTLNNFIVNEEGDHTLYFEEFVRDCRGESVSILTILIGIFQSFTYHISDEDHVKAMCQRLTETWEN